MYGLVISYICTALIIAFFASIFFVKDCEDCKKQNQKTHIAIIISIIIGTYVNPFVIPISAFTFIVVMFVIGKSKGGDK